MALQEHLRNRFGHLPKVEFALAEFFFRSFGISDVSNEGTEDPLLAEFEGHDFQLDGKLYAAAADRGDFNAPPQQRTFARGQEMPQPAARAPSGAAAE